MATIKNYKVYKHTAPNGKVYIGITSKKPEYRWNYGKGYEHNKYFHNAINKYGWDNIKHEILYDGLEETQAKLMEISLIHYYRSNNSNFGYNLTAGGDGVLGHSPNKETRKKLSDSHKGKKLTKEHRIHLSEARKGKIIGNTNGKTILQLEPNSLSIIKEWKSETLAAKSFGVGKGTISKHIKRGGFYKGYYWKWKEVA